MSLLGSVKEGLSYFVFRAFAIRIFASNGRRLKRDFVGRVKLELDGFDKSREFGEPGRVSARRIEFFSVILNSGP